MARIDPPPLKVDPPSTAIDPPSDEVDPPSDEVDPPSDEVGPPSDEIDLPAQQVDPPSTEVDRPPTGVDPPSTELDPLAAESRPPPAETDPPSTLHVQLTAAANVENGVLIIESTALRVRKTPTRRREAFAAVARPVPGTAKLIDEGRGPEGRVRMAGLDRWRQDVGRGARNHAGQDDHRGAFARGGRRVQVPQRSSASASLLR